MSLLAATWTSAITTVVLAVGAIVTAVYAIMAYRKQSKQTQLLQEQADRDIEQRRRAQASHVFTCIERRPFDGKSEDMREAVCIRNTSSQPVYDIVLGLGERSEQRWPVLMPASEHVRPGIGTDFITGRRSVWATFRDSLGNCWCAGADGKLTELQGKLL